MRRINRLFWLLFLGSIVDTACGDTQQTLSSPDTASTVRLRHFYHHGAGEYPYHQWLDAESVSEASSASAHELVVNSELRLVSQRRTRRRLRDRSRENLDRQRQRVRSGLVVAESEWTDEVITVPDVADYGTLLALSQMTSNAYVEEPHSDGWLDLGSHWNATPPWGFGWEGAGLRGHVYSDDDNSTVVISIKGTSAVSFLGKGSSGQDKLNDNLLFSCCCARVDFSWSTVCDCYSGTYTCDQTCLETELYREDHYYAAALDIFFNVSALYPQANIWVTGHSLGGAVAALMGLTFGVPVVALEAPGDALPSRRLHLPQPPALTGEDALIWHIGNNADPIFMGACTGPTSLCWAASYAMETRCHTGLTCEYDAVGDLGWRMSMQNHRINAVLDGIIKHYKAIPACEPDVECVDCYLWNFED